MTPITFDAKIAAGYDNVAGLTLITSLSADSIPFVECLELPDSSYVRGQTRVSTTGRVRHAGFPSKLWVSSILYLPQWEYLVSTYEGEVTIRTRLTGNTYANYNAVLDVQDWGVGGMAILSANGNAMKDFNWLFTRIRAI